jgi:hypothetical protein
LVIVERKVAKRSTKQKKDRPIGQRGRGGPGCEVAGPSAASAVEPPPAQDPDSDADADPLVFHSLYELMERAGTLPQDEVGQQQQQQQQQQNEADVPQHEKMGDASAAAAAALAPISDASPQSISPGSVVEADLEFRCMDPAAWEAVRHEVHQGDDDDDDAVAAADPGRGGKASRGSWLAAMPITQGRGTDDEHDEDHEEEEEEEDDDEYFDFMRSLKEGRHNNPDYYSSDEDEDDDTDAHDDDGGGDEDDDDRSERNHRMAGAAARTPRGHPPPTTATAPSVRPFLTLWNALCQWVTPQAARYLRAPTPSPGDLRPFEPVLDAENDVVASRLGGLYSQLQMHVPPALLALQYTNNPRLAWVRFGDLLRCFTYSRPMPSLSRNHLRALTAILLHSVLRNQDGFRGDDASVVSAVPPSCAEIGLSMAEYLHLTKVLVNFGRDDDDDNAVDPLVLDAGPAPVPQLKNGYH